MMREEFSNSDQKLRDKVNNHRIPAPEAAWAGIEQAIPANGGKRRGFFFISLIALLFIGGVTSFYLLSPTLNSSKKEQLSGGIYSKNQIDSTNTNNHKAPNKENTVITSDQAALAITESVANTETEGISDNTATIGGNKKHHSLPTQQANDSGVDSSAFTQNDKIVVNDDTLDTHNDKARYANSNQDNLGLQMQDGNDLQENRLDQRPSETSSTENQTLEENEALPSFLLPRSITTLPESYMETIVLKENSELPKPKMGKWSLEGGLGISTFNYKAQSSSLSFDEYLNGSQGGQSGYDGFLRVNYQPWKHFSFNTGAEFTRESFETTVATSITSTSTVIDTSGWTFDTLTQQQIPILDTTTTTSTTTQNQLFSNRANFVYIPIGVSFHLPLGNRSELGLRIAGSVGIRTKGQGMIISDQNGTTVDLNNAFQKVGNFHLRGAIRYNYLLNEHQSVFIEPWYGIGLNNRSTPAIPYSTRFSNYGINVGFKYNF